MKRLIIIATFLLLAFPAFSQNKDKTPERIHIKSVKLNGKPIKDYKITHQQIMAGGTLEFKMK